MADKDLVLEQFSAKQKRLDKRLADLDKLKAQLESGNRAKIKKAQASLKAAGRYGTAKIDGIHGKATTKALAAIRAELRADQAKLDKNLNAHLKRQAKASERALAGKKLEAGDNARKDKNAKLQTGYQLGALAVSVGVTKYQLNKLNKLDKPAVQARNKELGRYAKEIDTIKSDKKNLTKAKNLKVSAKRRIGAIAKSAKTAGVTTYKGPIAGPSSAALLLKAGLLKYAATQTENEVLKGALDATGNALVLAGAATPAARITQNSFGVNRLNGQHLAKIADAEEIAKSTAPKNVKARKAPKKTLFTGKAAKGIGKAAKATGKAVPFLGYGIAAYAAVDTAYRVFKKTGNSAQAATKGLEAGADSLTVGLYSRAKKDITRPEAEKEAIRSRNLKRLKKYSQSSKNFLRQLVAESKQRKANKVKVRSVQGALRDAKSANMKTANPKLKVTAGLTPSRIKIKAHTRKSNGRNVRVRASYRTIR